MEHLDENSAAGPANAKTTGSANDEVSCSSRITIRETKIRDNNSMLVSGGFLVVSVAWSMESTNLEIPRMASISTICCRSSANSAVTRGSYSGSSAFRHVSPVVSAPSISSSWLTRHPTGAKCQAWRA